MKPSLLLIFICFTFTLKGQLCDPNFNSLYFNGTDSYVEFGPAASLDITDDITVEAWINASSWGSSYVSNSIVCKHGWSSGERGYVLRAGGNGQLSFAIAGVNTSGTNVSWKEAVSPNNALQLNTWHHVAGTYNGDKIRIYVDGVQVKSVNFKGTIDPSVNYNLKIGRIADDSTADKRFFHGLIDEVRIWDEALSAGDINSRRSEHVDSSSVNHLIGYWRMNEGTGSTLTDMGTGGNQGTLVGAAWNAEVPFSNGILRPDIIEAGGVLTSTSLLGNQWNLNGVPIPGATGIQFAPLQNGVYSVSVDYGAGCYATSLNYTFIYTNVTEKNLQSLIKYYQSEDILFFNVLPSISNSTQIKLIDLNGRVIYNSAAIPAQLNIQAFAKGLYILSFQSHVGVFSERIVIW